MPYFLISARNWWRRQRRSVKIDIIVCVCAGLIAATLAALV
jgi:hypothetical protein